MLISEDATEPIVIREEDEEEAINIADIPAADEIPDSSRRAARHKRQLEGAEPVTVSDGSDSDNSALFVPGRPNKRSKTGKGPGIAEKDEESERARDDKKKLGLNTSYDGFSIYGRILCLVVKRRGVRTTGGGGGPASSQQMLETWVSTQAIAEHEDDEDVG
ncbi:hypothetical protein BDU57DRAFT_520876 [Ampelomyces quisqualis]|uniref:Uncharacterized protein n=1 Tax=Ampelomyces quisqualis TaxID=50730 RepID=A0A6A5QG86_AMPQU|nr:hypothetical protein BDU57DRAFT_520876 [Ampelomyces quisqualis]